MNLFEFLFPFRNLHARLTVYNGLWGLYQKNSYLYFIIPIGNAQKLMRSSTGQQV